MLNTAINAAEMILTLAPKINGQVALSKFTSRDHTHLTNKNRKRFVSAIFRPHRTKLSTARYGHSQLAYGFNYYGTVGSKRNEFVVARKIKNINWLDGEGNNQ